MSGNEKQRALAALHQGLARQEQRQEQLRREVAALAEENRRRSALLSSQRLSLSRAKIIELVAAALILGTGWVLVYDRLHPGEEPAALPRQVYRPLSPHLLITSEPSGAQLSLDGSPLGTTPQLVTSKPGRYRVQVAHPGYLSLTRSLEIQLQAGRHWHAVLWEDCGGSAEQQAEAPEPSPQVPPQVIPGAAGESGQNAAGR